MISNAEFKLKEIPHYFPGSVKYLSWWREQKRRCIEGYWVSGKWMPGKLYFYINFGTIKRNIGLQKVKTYARPLLRDLEWQTFLYWEEARGFSGFLNDTEYTCLEIIRDIRESGKDTPSPAIVSNYPHGINPDTGKLKKYIPAREYLAKNHIDNLGRPLYENNSKNIFMLGARGYGKDLHKDTLLWYEDAKKPISQVKVGDRIFGADGQLTTVTNVFKYTDQLQYEITLADGRKVKCGAGHKWAVWERDHRGKKHKVVKELKDILLDYKTEKRKDAKYFIDLCNPLMYEWKDQKIHPYTLGALLGDGGLTQRITFTTADPEILDYMELPEGCEIVKTPSSKYAYSIRGTERQGKNTVNPVTAALKEYGLWGKKSTEKFIPEEYMKGDFWQRVMLLRGLMDTDGSISKKGQIEFSQSNKILAYQVKELCEGLGIRCKISERETTHKKSYRLNIITSNDIFLLKRKSERINRNPSNYASTNRTMVAIRNIQPTTVEDSYCISVDNKDSLFIVNDCIPTHNSYSVGSIVAHEFLFDGQTHYDPQSPVTAAEIVVGAGDAKYSAETLDKARIIIEQLPGGQEVNGVYHPAPFFKRWRGTWEPGKQITAKYKKKVGNAWREVGSGSNIKHRTFKDNPFAANGTRPGLMIFEEVGMFSNLKESYAASVECQREGATKFGSMFFIGTGGDMSSGTLDAMEIFYAPEQYDCITFNDDWENRGKIGYFVPAYMALHDYMDSDGKIDTEGAKFYLEKEREKLRKTKGSSTALEGEIINRPLVPSEMFLQRTGSIFPIVELRKRLNTLEQNNSWDYMEKPVSLYFDPEAKMYNGVNYTIDTKKELSPINSFPWKSNNKEGAVMIYEFPQLIDNRVPPGAYIIGYDPYAKDDPDGESLASIIVLKTKKYINSIGHDEIVATYYGRPFQGRHIVNETLYKLSKFYGNATIYFENVRGNTKEYFEKIKRLDLLARKPQTILTKKASFNQAAPQEYGYPMSSRQMKLDCAQYVRDWLMEERGNDLRNLDFIYDKFLLEQLIAFNMDGNFDAVMGLFGCIIGLNETYNQYEQSLMSDSPKNKMEQDISKLLVNNKFLFNGKYK